jgi:hypothetical protein
MRKIYMTTRETDLRYFSWLWKDITVVYVQDVCPKFPF